MLKAGPAREGVREHLVTGELTLALAMVALDVDQRTRWSKLPATGESLPKRRRSSLSTLEGKAELTVHPSRGSTRTSWSESEPESVNRWASLLSMFGVPLSLARQEPNSGRSVSQHCGDFMMRLSIGKNHGKDIRPVESIFRLIGNDEDALTYALGFLLARDPEFCAKVVRLCGVRRIPRDFRDTYTVHLQEVPTGASDGGTSHTVFESANRSRSQDP